jgi:hypothetical protein
MAMKVARSPQRGRMSHVVKTKAELNYLPLWMLFHSGKQFVSGS